MLDAFASYFKAQGLFGMPRAGDIDYTKSLTLDLASIKPSLAGPKRPQDRIEMGDLKSTFTRLYSASVAENGFGQPADKLLRRYSTKPGKPGHDMIPDSTLTLHGAAAPRDLVEMVNNRPTPARVTSTTGTLADIGNGDVLIAAITSCTNTSNPSVLLAAGLLAKKAVEKGLAVKPRIKTSMAPCSRVVTDSLGKS